MRKLAIIIPTKGKVEMLFDLLRSIREKTTHDNYEVYVADTGSTDEELRVMRQTINSYGWNLLAFDSYNFACINNVVVKGLPDDVEVLVFCNNDIVLINDAITMMAETHDRHSDIAGTIGCTLLYPDHSIQHGGVQINDDGVSYRRPDEPYDSLSTQFVLGNACGLCLVERKLFERIGMFDERFTECFEDVKMSIDCLVAGKRNIFVGEAWAYHYESTTRNEDPKGKVERRNHDRQTLKPYLFKHRNLLENYNE